MSSIFNNRDERGWRTPKPTTLSYSIYELTLQGNSPAAIAAITKKPVNIVRVLIHRFKHPDQHNQIALKSYHRKRKKDRTPSNV